MEEVQEELGSESWSEEKSVKVARKPGGKYFHRKYLNHYILEFRRTVLQR
jgi:hypothetical protein